MITKQFHVLVLLSLCCFTSSKARVYYIIASNYGSCITVNGTTLSPCYTLHQLINDEVLSSTNESSVALLFLPGTHLISEHQTLSTSNLSNVIIHPWDEEEEVSVECQLGAGLSFQNINNLKILFMRFTFCSLEFVKTQEIINGNIECSFNIDKCIFEGSKNYAIIINVTRSEVNFTASRCLFSSNNGAIHAINERYKLPMHILMITDTIFQNNWRDELI